MCERTIAEYEEELCPTKEEKERQHEKHQVVLHRTDVWEEHLHPEQQKWSFRMEPQPSHIKKEEEHPLIPHFKEEEEDPLNTHIKEEEEDPLIPHFKKEEEDPLIPHFKEEEEDPLIPHFKKEEEDPLTPHFKKEAVDPLSPHIKEEKEDPLTPHIKEEEEEHSISQQGEHLEGLEEVDVTKMPVTGVPVKSEGDEVKGESEEKREAEPPSSSSTQHMTTEADGDHCGGSQADKLLAPLSDSEDTTSHSPDTDDEDSKDDKTCHTDNTHFTCSHLQILVISTI
ncbi:uncharacterized protein [Nerophis lumbriciformis]|uniref:uncharacterized protein n=1 Tax=Nerophis lumbriciformis TaxID=546530 RepID=UPI003BAA0105